MGEKEKILEKLNIRDYRNELELILENKQFNEEAKSLILNIFYKLDNFYKDYQTVKTNCEIKNKFLEEYINIIKNDCNKIEVLNPQNFTKQKKYTINKPKGEITSFPSEGVLMYAIYELAEKTVKNDSSDFTSKCVIHLLNKGKTINNTEVIRDFTGWSWNVQIEDSKSIEYNLIFQNLLILFGYNFTVKLIDKPDVNNILKNEIDKKVWKEYKNELLANLQKVSISMYNNVSKSTHKECMEFKNSILEIINTLNNRKDYINEITKNNNTMIKEIQKIDIVLNDINLIRKGFEENIQSGKEEFFSISDFVDNMEKQRDGYLKNIENNNKILSPRQYLKCQDQNKRLLKLYEKIGVNNTKVEMQEDIINLQKVFLKCMQYQISKTDTKKNLYNLARDLRYYSNMMYKKGEKIISEDELSEVYEKVARELIMKMIYNKIIYTGFQNRELNYQIIKYVFKSKIIKLDNMYLKIKFISKREIEVEYLDGDVVEHREKFKIPDSEEIINMKDRKIKLLRIS